ncbi:MAG: hypothetical protein ACJ8HI_08760 [Massilia sp.]
MARDTWAYREVAVESFIDARGVLRLRPMAGQAFAPSLPVHAARSLTDPVLYPPGSRFLLNAKLTDRLGGPQFLYTYHNDPVTVLSAAAAKRFLLAFRRGRI